MSCLAWFHGCNVLGRCKWDRWITCNSESGYVFTSKAWWSCLRWGNHAYSVWWLERGLLKMRFGASMTELLWTPNKHAWQLRQQLTEVLKLGLVFLVFTCLNESVIWVYVGVVLGFGNGPIFKDVTCLASYGAGFSLWLSMCCWQSFSILWLPCLPVAAAFLSVRPD